MSRTDELRERADKLARRRADIERDHERRRADPTRAERVYDGEIDAIDAERADIGRTLRDLREVE